jgi:hypothetical protein
MKINNLLLSTLVLGCSIAFGENINSQPTPTPAPTPTKAEAEKSLADTTTATQENSARITEHTSNIRSLWKATIDASTKKATLTVTRTDNNTTEPFVIRGICYSPAPMNGSNEYGPALGDWYWNTLVNPDNPGDVWAYTWESAWARDLDNLRALGINCIRVYSMLYKQIGQKGEIPTKAQYDKAQVFTHKKFLDLCWNNGKNPIYVIVGVPLDPLLFRVDVDTKAIQYYWENVLVDTAKDLEKHPAVLGFTIANEVDGAQYTWDEANPNSTKVQGWWGQVQKFAQMVKTVAPNKLVGIANHDVGDKLEKYSQPWMDLCTSIDFWGVNSYQTANFDSVFGTGPYKGFNQLKGVALKPVILTEWGLPATGHHDPNDRFSIYADTATETKTADVVSEVLPKAYQEPLCLGVTYFEFCDEWWKQPQPNGVPAILYKWFGGTSNPGFPNGYWDDEGFGVYSIERAGYDGSNPQVRKITPYFHSDDPWYTGPYQPDVQTIRQPLFNAIKKTFESVK